MSCLVELSMKIVLKPRGLFSYFVHFRGCTPLNNILCLTGHISDCFVGHNMIWVNLDYYKLPNYKKVVPKVLN